MIIPLGDVDTKQIEEDFATKWIQYEVVTSVNAILALLQRKDRVLQFYIEWSGNISEQIREQLDSLLQIYTKKHTDLQIHQTFIEWLADIFKKSNRPLL